MFYFLTFDHTDQGPFDNTKILSAHPEALGDVHHPAWGPLGSSHYWGEPLFGYYTSDDEAVLRKHAEMLSNAGVDVVVFDNSNAVTYRRARDTLLRVWESIRREGGMTPKVAFLCPFGNPGGIGSSTLKALYEEVYAPGRDADLWFRWRGKPLVLADPGYAAPQAFAHVSARYPARLEPGATLAQSFVADRPFLAAGGSFPTWATKGSGATLSLYADGRRLTAQRKLTDMADNAPAFVESPQTLPPGRYTLELSQAVGTVGWWSDGGRIVSGGKAFERGEPVTGGRTLSLRYADGRESSLLHEAKNEDAAKEARTIRDFFTFRTPIAPYNLKTPPPNAWAWLQIAPQAAQRDASGAVEEVAVGVAQNYNGSANRTAPMSFPGSFGRSFHDGQQDTRPNAVRYGFNFEEQWRRAREIDPPFVFVTGWNEWTAGLYDDWAGFHAPPAIFVDEFDEERSRDIEPMRGGHGDDYYYQLVTNVRRYKGARALPPVTPRPITIDGRFDDWRWVGPEYRDAIGDPVHRDAEGVGHSGRYVDRSGRNDLVTTKVSFDAKTLYFYVRTREAITSRSGGDWMRLYLDTDGDPKNGWLGYDFALNGAPGVSTTDLARWSNGRWRPVGRVRYAVRGGEMEIAVPRSMLGRVGSHVDFKWADHCFARGDWTDFTLNGDAAPDDRFSYRAILR